MPKFRVGFVVGLVLLCGGQAVSDPSTVGGLGAAVRSVGSGILMQSSAPGVSVCAKPSRYGMFVWKEEGSVIVVCDLNIMAEEGTPQEAAEWTHKAILHEVGHLLQRCRGGRLVGLPAAPGAARWLSLQKSLGSYSDLSQEALDMELEAQSFAETYSFEQAAQAVLTQCRR